MRIKSFNKRDKLKFLLGILFKKIKKFRQNYLLENIESVFVNVDKRLRYRHIQKLSYFLQNNNFDN